MDSNAIKHTIKLERDELDSQMIIKQLKKIEFMDQLDFECCLVYNKKSKQVSLVRREECEHHKQNSEREDRSDRIQDNNKLNLAGRFLFGKIDIHTKINNEENKERGSVISMDGDPSGRTRDESMSMSSSSNIKHYSIKNIE